MEDDIVEFESLTKKKAWNTRHPDPVKEEEEDPYDLCVLYWHEVLDRAHVARDHFFEYVEKHPVIMNDEELNIEAEKVTSAMDDFYHLVEVRYHEFETLIIDPVKTDLVEVLVRASKIDIFSTNDKAWIDGIVQKYALKKEDVHE